MQTNWWRWHTRCGKGTLMCCFEGDVDRPLWAKPVALTGIEVEGWIPKSVRRFYEQFEAASQLQLTHLLLYVE